MKLLHHFYSTIVVRPFASRHATGRFGRYTADRTILSLENM